MQISFLHPSRAASNHIPNNHHSPLPSNEGCGHGLSTLKDSQQVWGGRRGMWQNTRRCRMSVCVRRLVTSPLLTDFVFRTTTTVKHTQTAEALHNTCNASTTTKKNHQCKRPLAHVHDMRPRSLLPCGCSLSQAGRVQQPSQPSASCISPNVLHERERDLEHEYKT
jgi:hypothetical protein